MSGNTDASTSSQHAHFPTHRRMARECTLQFLYQLDCQDDWEITENSLSVFWQQVETERGLNPDDRLFTRMRAYAEKLINGIVAEHDFLDRQIKEQAEHWSLSRMSAIDRNILRISCFELFRCGDQTPPVTAINEGVELAKIYGDAESARFVNGILDRLMQEQKSQEKQD